MVRLNDDDRRQRLLKQDVEKWLSGLYPDSLLLAAAPVLHEWKVIWKPTNSITIMKIEGIISGSPTKTDGDAVRTAPIALLDRKFTWARTVNTLYVLGQQAGEEIGFGVDLDERTWG
jgi:hypothetical protein